jgi:hypothetical protein
MADRFDFELRAIEADMRAEAVGRFSLAENWRDIAIGYRLAFRFPRFRAGRPGAAQDEVSGDRLARTP